MKDLKNLNKTTKKSRPLKTQKLHAKVDVKTDRKIRKIAKETGFTISYVVTELLTKAISTGLAKDIFWLFLKNHSDPFLDAETSEDWEDIERLKEAISTIQAVVSAQEKRIDSLEKSQSHMVNGLKQASKGFTLTKFFEDENK